jgi:hypothetical protein
LRQQIGFGPLNAILVRMSQEEHRERLGRLSILVDVNAEYVLRLSFGRKALFLLLSHDYQSLKKKLTGTMNSTSGLTVNLLAPALASSQQGKLAVHHTLLSPVSKVVPRSSL